MTETVLRGIRVSSKQDLAGRLLQYIDEINAAPVPFRWKHGLEPIADAEAQVVG